MDNIKIINNKKNPNNIIYGPAVAVDTVIFAIVNKVLHVLLIQIGNGPYNECWAIPGGLVLENESTDTAAGRILKSKTNISNLYLEQLYTFGDPDRDVRGQAISVAYFSILNSPNDINLKTESHYNGINWYPVTKLPKMAFDHAKIVNYAHSRLKAKMEYTNIAYNFLPKEFTLTQLQEIYEIVWEKNLDKRNFRKRIENLKLLKETKKVLSSVNYRPAKLYTFAKQKLEFIK